MEWTYDGIMKAGSSLMTSAEKINQLIGTFEDLTTSIVANYDSPNSQALLAKFQKIKELGPEFNAEVVAASKKLTDEVAPAYAKVEQKNEAV